MPGDGIKVLIVPFMELKRRLPGSRLADPWVLIVPFMELKLGRIVAVQSERTRLNRTFYGIET